MIPGIPGILDQVVPRQLFWSWNTEVRQHHGQLHVVAVSVTSNRKTKQGWLWWFTSKKAVFFWKTSLVFAENIWSFDDMWKTLFHNHIGFTPKFYAKWILRVARFILPWAKQIHNAFVCQSGDKQLSSSANSSANWRPHCSRWVWVKIRYPNNWMVNTKLD